VRIQRRDLNKLLDLRLDRGNRAFFGYNAFDPVEFLIASGVFRKPLVFSRCYFFREILRAIAS